jgi:type II secretory pathway pseudopilin PulG
VVHGNIRRKARVAAFTLVEAMVAISVLGIGVASAVGALTKFNSIASISRNATGAYAAVMNQIDLIQSDAPFNPQKTNPDGTAQIPPELRLGKPITTWPSIRIPTQVSSSAGP